jgi:hypothetical protein
MSDPDWAGVVVHYPSGSLVMLQLAHPRGELSVEVEAVDMTLDGDAFRSFIPGPKFGRVNLAGPVLTSERRYGERPDWATVQREIERSTRAITP